MCGYLCTGCGKCGVTKPRVKPFGTCFKCGYVNEKGATQCKQCGAELIRLPGQGSASPAKA